jgi:hypothetical protein
MKRFYYVAKVLFLGLCAAQVIATAQVYLSDVHLYRTLLAIRDAGYLPIPNQEVMPRLKEFGPAFFGGLFFTLSVGAGLSLSAFAAVWLWDRLFFRNKYLAILLLMLWAGCLIAVNYHGINLMVTAYFVVIPTMVIVATLRWMPLRSIHEPYLARIVYCIPIFLLALLWLAQVDSHLFFDLRDNLLLTNRIGTKINDFYYRYTLYPAEVFKSFDQKLLKAYHLENIQNKSTAQSIENKLAHYDYLHVQGDSSADLTIAQEGNSLRFKYRGRTILRVTPTSVLSDPGKALREFSLGTDRHKFFRQCAFFSLLIGLPFILYVILFTLFYLILGFFLATRTSTVIASALCFVIGLTVLGTFHHSRVKTDEVKNVAEALESERWQKRVAALKCIEQGDMEISDFRTYRTMLESPRISERYWLVKALGASRKPETYKDLLGFLDDPHPTVVSIAFHAIGRRGDRRAVKEILARINTSHHWYNQWHAYNGLKKLGWKQTRLK